MLLFIWTVLALISGTVSTQRNEYSVPDEVDCDLPWATYCFDDLSIKLNSSFKGSLEHYCNSANYTINVCLKDILTAEGCSEKYPRHSFYSEWLKPINSALSKFCALNKDNIRDFQNSMKCFQENFFSCLEHGAKSLGSMGILELITSQMIPDVCSNLALKVEQCMEFNTVPECSFLVNMVLELVEEFIETSTCKEQPPILVPLDRTKEFTDDCSPELEMEIIGKCFIPIKEASTAGGVPSQALHSFCLSTNETLFCLMNLLLNNNNNDNECGNRQLPYQDWLEILSIIDEGFCDPKYDSGQLENCWTDFYTCLQNSNAMTMLEDMLFNKVKPDTCRNLSDEMEICLIDIPPGCQDKFEEILSDLRKKFEETPLCMNNNYVGERSLGVKGNLGGTEDQTVLRILVLFINLLMFTKLY